MTLFVLFRGLRSCPSTSTRWLVLLQPPRKRLMREQRFLGFLHQEERVVSPRRYVGHEAAHRVEIANQAGIGALAEHRHLP